MKNMIKIGMAALFGAVTMNYHYSISYNNEAQASVEEIPHVEILENRYESILPHKKKLEMLNDPEVHCMAQNLFQEALKNHDMDIIMIGYGVLNRVNDSRFPDTICKVVKQKGQFSWYKSASKRAMRVPLKYYKTARQIISGVIQDPAPWCQYTNWYNTILDSKKSFNYKIMHSVNSCTVHIEGTPHYYIGYSDV